MLARSAVRNVGLSTPHLSNNRIILAQGVDRRNEKKHFGLLATRHVHDTRAPDNRGLRRLSIPL
ncbi:hypothetical protein D3C84_1288240 [compost metagenome]